MVEIKHKYKISLFKDVYILTFIAGKYVNIELKNSPNDSNSMRVFAHLHGTEVEIISRFTKLTDFTVRELKVNTQQQKLALWCELYKMQYNALAYKVNSTDATKVKNVEFSQDLIISSG